MLRYLAPALLAFAALWLRTSDLARRPMHADEANQAVKFGELVEHGRYAFDPVAWARGQTTLATLDETTVRLVPAIVGTAGVLLLFALALPFGYWPALAAAALLAIAPASVYYSRYFIQETLLVTFALAAFVCAGRWWRTGRLGWALAAGACAGLMQATKASAPVFLACAAIAFFAVSRARPVSARIGRDALLALGTALVVAALFYSSFGAHFAGLRDAVATYTHASGRAAGGSGHEKPWWYYLSTFGWYRQGGLLWQQLGFSLLAGAGIVVAFARRQTFLRVAAVYTALVLVALSLTPYKTPWHLVHLVPGFAVLASGALAALPWRPLAVAVAAAILAVQFTQTNLAVFRRPADERNPYAYVHSSPDVLKIRSLAEAALARSSAGAIRVVSEEYWPLPWYLRGLPRIGYWPAPPADCDGPLVIASATQAEAVRARLHGDYQESYLGLRPGVLCVVFTPVSKP
ncbi:MAG: TIGR03663 family protein [Verrucomicrobia bacterium]|nr:TIGR03663 family protein [Verrucomicrobiota bacterium]